MEIDQYIAILRIISDESRFKIINMFRAENILEAITTFTSTKLKRGTIECVG